ncbi:MAG: hypothetical protein R3D80_20915 [Paracoccaceae bacterium]
MRRLPRRRREQHHFVIETISRRGALPRGRHEGAREVATYCDVDLKDLEIAAGKTTFTRRGGTLRAR